MYTINGKYPFMTGLLTVSIFLCRSIERLSEKNPTHRGCGSEGVRDPFAVVSPAPPPASRFPLTAVIQGSGQRDCGF